jgi:FKBP-type peptidyl-prolyl cis-trans isomerase FkpA
MNQKGNTSVIVSLVAIVIVVGLVVYVLMHKPDASSSSQEVSTSTSQPQQQSTPSQQAMNPNERLLPNFTPIAHVDALQKIDTVVGTGAEVKPGDTVSVQYTGAVAATGVIFQSSKDFGTDPVTFPLDGVIKGWTDGIPGMKVGGTRRLIIPAAEAYGANPPAGSGIPANADLVFDVELVAIGQ